MLKGERMNCVLYFKLKYKISASGVLPVMGEGAFWLLVKNNRVLIKNYRLIIIFVERLGKKPVHH